MIYVFVCPDINSLTIQYRDFENKENCRLAKVGGIKRKISKLLSVLGITSIERLDFLFANLFNNIFDDFDYKDYCFILYARTYEDFRGSICRYLKNKYTGCKVVVYFGDLVKSHIMPIDEVKKNSDAIFTFDEDEAQKYGLNWLLEPFSTSVVSIPELQIDDCKQEWDVTFVGRAKERYDKIISIYEKLKNLGVRCDFHIVGVPNEKRKYKDEISYKPLSFIEILQHVKSSKCVLEIMQDKGFSPTTRYTEAMLLGRNLLTDCIAFDNDKKPPNIIYFIDEDDIDDKIVERIKQECDFDRKKYFDLFSIETMISNIWNVVKEK